MARRDDAAVVGVAGQRWVMLLDRLGQGCDQRGHHLAGCEQIVGRHTGLAGVEQFAESQACGGQVQIATAVDQGRRFATELERHRRQVLRRGLGDQPADVGRAGEKQMVKGQGDKGPTHFGIAADHLHFVWREIFADHPRHQRRGCRRQLRRLDHHPVARGQRGQRRIHRQVVRVVPGRDDADHAERLAQELVAGRQKMQRCWHAARLHPAAQMTQGMAHTRLDGKDIGQQAFLARALAEILRNRLHQFIGIALRHRQQALQPVTPHRQVRAHLGVKCRALLRQHQLQSFLHGFVHCDLLVHRAEG